MPINGIVVYEGPSNFDNSPIVAIATGLHKGSTNRKTGPMVQIFIVKQEQNPYENWQNDSYTSVCGDCKHGHKEGNSCYVELQRHGVVGVYNAWKRGSYSKINTESDYSVFAGKSVRFGAYGDPAAVPMDAWLPILNQLKATNGSWTSYTHAWKYCDPIYKEFCVASVDNPQELEQARESGWRTFRTLIRGEALTKGEFYCPATDEHFNKTGKMLQCITCGVCDGLNGKTNKRGSAAIVVHGRTSKIQNYITIRNTTLVHV